MRTFAALPALAALSLACAGARTPDPGAPVEASPGQVLRAAELARVKCLLVAPFENAADAPLAEAATATMLAGVDASRTRVLPVPALRAIFRDTPLELPEGISGSLALELGEIVGADAALYGAVEGRSRGGSALVVTARLVLVAGRDLLWAASVPVEPAPGERVEAAVRRTLEAVAAPMLARLGDPGRKRCFDPERTKEVRAMALAEARAAAPTPPPAARPAPAPAPTPAPAAAQRPQTQTPRQAEWARRLAAAGRLAAEDVVFAGRSAEVQRDAGLADLAVALASVPDVKVRVEAFVDTTGDPEADARLSGAMAQAAVRRLVDLGIARERVSWAGRGGESPRLPNFTARGRAANRRIEIVGLR